MSKKYHFVFDGTNFTCRRNELISYICGGKRIDCPYCKKVLLKAYAKTTLIYNSKICKKCGNMSRFDYDK